ncbi:hypothetical protein EUGRSUZ_F02218 [Eucalyptus grandis]|uniref:Uncharacterized protein n=2 Tax=Eucalyptus grandis TaxID=71139 RepID=A0ACC3KHA1_EUCGR|nr:hypothetical protein EUGRSUZ_F02218 [Eucalyptus grandis]
MPASSQSWNIPNPHLTKKAAPRITRRNKESPSFQRSRSYYLLLSILNGKNITFTPPPVVDLTNPRLSVPLCPVLMFWQGRF